MRKLHKDDKLKFYLGDVRDRDACFDAVQGGIMPLLRCASTIVNFFQCKL